MYLLRLDDASEHMDIDKWLRIERMLDKYGIKPIYGIIPHNQDPELLKYPMVEEFWDMMRRWQEKGWVPAMHGFTHVFETCEGGINPVNIRSEYAGVAYEVQCKKIKDGYKILKEQGIVPGVFFAPAHTFDENTLLALKKESDIRIISDTVANDVYYKGDIYFVPQQSGHVRKMPLKTVTFCYHPNILNEEDFVKLEEFLMKYRSEFGTLDNNILKKRKYGLKDMLFRSLYFIRRKML